MTTVSMMDGSGMKSMNPSVTSHQVAPGRLLAFPPVNSTKSSHVPPLRQPKLTSTNLFHAIVRSAATGSDLDPQEYQYRPLPACHSASKSNPCAYTVIHFDAGCRPSLWRGGPAVCPEQLAPFHAHDTYGYGLAQNNEMESHISQVGMNVSEDIKGISWLWMFI